MVVKSSSPTYRLTVTSHSHLSLVVIYSPPIVPMSFPGGSGGKDLPANAGDIRDVGSIPELGRSPGGGHDNPLQYSCLENPMDRGVWQATVHRVAKSQTRLR